MIKRNKKNLLVYAAMVGPGLLLYLLIITYPIIYSVWLSFTDFNPNIGGIGNFVGLQHYEKMISDSRFWHAFGNNMVVVGVSVFGQIPIALVLSYILYRKLVCARNFFQAMIFLPQFLSTIVIGVMWKRAFAANGPVSRLIQMFTGDVTAQFTMMLDQKTVMIPIGFALIWMYTGLYVIIFLANLQKINRSTIEAAMIDGSSEATTFFRIIIPSLAPTIVVCAILAIAGSLKGFDLIFAMTTRGLTRENAMVLPIYMYVTAFQDYANEVRFAYGAAISNMIVFISVGLIILSNFIGKKLDPTKE
jgi:raffinose/stachyose/melibiose transport system permease protein